MFTTRSTAPGYAITSTYERLGKHLTAIGAATIILSFAEIETFLGPLPTVARHHLQWWRATPFGRYNTVQSLRWGRVYSALRNGLFDSLGDVCPRAVRPLPRHAHRSCSPASLAASRFVLPDADFLSSFRRAGIVAAARGIPLAHTCSVSPASTG